MSGEHVRVLWDLMCSTIGMHNRSSSLRQSSIDAYNRPSGILNPYAVLNFQAICWSSHACQPSRPIMWCPTSLLRSGWLLEKIVPLGLCGGGVKYPLMSHQARYFHPDELKS